MVAHARDTPLYGYFPSTTAFLCILSVFCVAMWLTALLLGARWTPGKQWIGKHRRVLKMTATRRRNQEEREAQIKRVGRSRQSSHTRRCVPGYLAFRACVILHGLVSYISPAEGFATSIKKILQYTGVKGQNGSHAFLSCKLIDVLIISFFVHRILISVTDTFTD